MTISPAQLEHLNSLQCKFEIKVQKACRAMGSFRLTETEEAFADNDIGNGSIVRLENGISSPCWAELTWLSWDHCQWREVG